MFRRLAPRSRRARRLTLLTAALLLSAIVAIPMSGLAQAIGVDRKQVRRWSQGVQPCGGAMLALVRFARRIPGGLDILLGEEPSQQDEEDQNGA